VVAESTDPKDSDRADTTCEKFQELRAMSVFLSGEVVGPTGMIGPDSRLDSGRGASGPHMGEKFHPLGLGLGHSAVVGLRLTNERPLIESAQHQTETEKHCSSQANNAHNAKEFYDFQQDKLSVRHDRVR
jgi:hypothetical protein